MSEVKGQEVSYSDPAASVPPGSQEHIRIIQDQLLAVWDRGHRDLPWRNTSDPYAILVSELMLQQTQVDRVAPKWRAFMERFPTLSTLAAAPVSEVIRLWAGLGYNRRAVNLHRLAITVEREHNGKLPDTALDLQQLPGIGPYTARAVAAIAFARPEAAVDTNVRRVITRLVDGLESDRGPREVQVLADGFLVPERSGDWNQVLMEHGALICTAAAPRCGECPLQRWCAAAPEVKAVRERGPGYRLPRTAKPQGRFEHSTRFYRGRIVEALRVQEAHVPLGVRELGSRLRLDFDDTALSWLHGLLTGLGRDGLIEWDQADDTVRLPDQLHNLPYSADAKTPRSV